MPRRFPLAVRFAASLLAAFLLHSGRAAACAPELTESGLGGITRDTPFDAAEIAAALPGCRVERGDASSEGEPVDVLVVKDGTKPAALVFPDWTGGIFSVLMQGSAVRNRFGAALGMRFASVFGRSAAPVCVPGVEDSSSRVMCPVLPGSRVAYVFEGTWNGPDSSLPSPEVLASWTLVAFLWRPTPFEDPRWVDVAGFDPGEGPALADRVRDAVDDPAALAKLVLYPIVLRSSVGGAEKAMDIPDPGTFVTEYGRRLTPAFVTAVRDEPVDRVHIDDNGAALASGRIWIAPVCLGDDCAEHRAGVIAVTMF